MVDAFLTHSWTSCWTFRIWPLLALVDFIGDSPSGLLQRGKSRLSLLPGFCCKETRKWSGGGEPCPWLQPLPWVPVLPRLGSVATMTSQFGVSGWAWVTCPFCMPLTSRDHRRGSDWASLLFFQWKVTPIGQGVPLSHLQSITVMTIIWLNKCRVFRTRLYSAHGKCQKYAVLIMKQGTVSDRMDESVEGTD